MKKKIKEDLENAIICEKLNFEAREAYKLLRANSLFTLPDSGSCRTIGITSAIRGEGKSTVSINTAYTFAETGARVLLIDMDLRLPSIAKKFQIDTGKGLSDYLIGGVNLNEILKKYKKYDNWHVITSGTIPATPSELIGSEAMMNFMNLVKNNYDIIIVDLPPVNIVSDALVAKNIVDGFIVVVRENYSNKRSLNECVRKLEFINANLLGFVMVDAQGNSKKYSYNRKYKKSYAYDKYGKYGYGYGYGPRLVNQETKDND